MRGSRTISLDGSRWPEAKCRHMLLRDHLKASGWKVTDEVVKAARATRYSSINVLPTRGPLPTDQARHKFAASPLEPP